MQNKAPERRTVPGLIYLELVPMNYFIRIIFLVLLYLPAFIL